VKRIALVPLAQHSAGVYAADARPAALEAHVDLVCASNWGQTPALCKAFAGRIVDALGTGSDESTSVIMTAHSLPRSIIDAGDPYEREVRAAAATIAELVEGASRDFRVEVAFQSQGLAAGPGGAAWLGPDLATALDASRARGDRRVVFAPIGFLADHVETLYDLDIEARKMAADRNLSYARAKSLNSDDDLIEALTEVARPLLTHG
jgi:ferrochelatase